MTSQRGATIEFDCVTKTYGATRALDNFSLSVRAGEFVTLLGSSGSGKSTALNALAGFMPADEGQVRIDGRSVNAEPPERRNIGMVFQSYSLFPHMTVAQNVAFPLKMRGITGEESTRRVQDALDVVRLGAFGNRRPQQLSGGQQQRVAIARAIVFNPPVLLMDEPLGALDLKLREALQFEIKEIQHRLNCTVVYVTHDQREALAMSDRIVVLRDGRIEQLGSPADMYDRPATRFVADFIGQTNLLPADLSVPGQVTLPDLGLSYADSRQTGRKGKWLASIRPGKFEIRSADVTELSFPLKVIEPIFFGDVVECTGLHASGKTLHFRVPRSQAQVPLERNQRVSLAVRPADVVLVEDV